MALNHYELGAHLANTQTTDEPVYEIQHLDDLAKLAEANIGHTLTLAVRHEIEYVHGYLTAFAHRSWYGQPRRSDEPPAEPWPLDAIGGMGNQQRN